MWLHIHDNLSVQTNRILSSVKSILVLRLFFLSQGCTIAFICNTLKRESDIIFDLCVQSVSYAVWRLKRTFVHTWSFTFFLTNFFFTFSLEYCKQTKIIISKNRTNRIYGTDKKDCDGKKNNCLLIGLKKTNKMFLF